MVLPNGLSKDEETILSVYKLRRIRFGYGLTHSPFAHELCDRPDVDVRGGLDRMVGGGLLKVLPEVPDFYILTPEGERRLRPPARGGPAAGEAGRKAVEDAHGG